MRVSFLVNIPYVSQKKYFIFDKVFWCIIDSMNTILPIAFQGELGANSDIAARSVFPNNATLPCLIFADVFTAVREGKADYAMIPIDNSIAGRVADIHHLLRDTDTVIIGEHFQLIEHRLFGIPASTLETIREVHSHVHALAQCRTYLREHKLRAVVTEDTAGAAREVREKGDPTIGAIASPLAGTLYGLAELARNIEDAEHNTTRFVIIAREARIPEQGTDEKVITSIFFRLRSVPAALYKAIGGFATNGINLLKLESYLGDGFQSAEFYIEAEAHPDDTAMKLALQELEFFSEEVRFLGTYPAHPYRKM